MTKLKEPSAWEIIDGIRIVDPDGWRVDGKPFDEPIDREEWNRRMGMSTIHMAKDDYFLRDNLGFHP